MDFEVVGNEIVEGRMSPFSVVLGYIVADFQVGFDQVTEATSGRLDE